VLHFVQYNLKKYLFNEGTRAFIEEAIIPTKVGINSRRLITFSRLSSEHCFWQMRADEVNPE